MINKKIAIKAIKYRIAERIGKKIQFNSYWCGKCNKEHRKFAKKEVYSLIFVEHIKYKSELTSTQLLLKGIKKSWKLYAKSKKYLINKKKSIKTKKELIN